MEITFRQFWFAGIEMMWRLTRVASETILLAIEIFPSHCITFLIYCFGLIRTTSFKMRLNMFYILQWFSA